HPGIYPARAKPGRPRKRPQPSRLGPGAHAAARKAWQHDGPARQLRESQPALSRADGAIRRHPPAAAAAKESVAHLGAMVQAPPPTRQTTAKGRVLLWLLGQLQRPAAR